MGAKVVGHILAGVVALAFAATGVAKLAAWSPYPENFLRWGLPSWFMVVAGIIEVVGALLLMIPQTRVVGAGVLVVAMLGALGVHLFAGELNQIYAPVVLAVLAATAGGLQIQKLRQA